MVICMFSVQNTACFCYVHYVMYRLDFQVANCISVSFLIKIAQNSMQEVSLYNDKFIDNFK
jgi:hypothetical protein